MRHLFASILFAFASLAFAQPQTVTTTAVQTITGQKTFSGSDKLCLKDPADTDKLCLMAPSLGSATVSLTLPSSFGTGVVTWLQSPTGANLVSALSSGGGTTNYLRADGSFAAPPGTGGLSGLTTRYIPYATSATAVADSGIYWHTDLAAILGGISSVGTGYKLQVYNNSDGDAGVFVENSSGGTNVSTAHVLRVASNDQLVINKWGTANTSHNTGASGAMIANYVGHMNIGTMAAKDLKLFTNGESNTRVTISSTGEATFSGTPTFSTMTAGSILFAGTSGVLSQNNAGFNWDNANLRLNLGTATTTSGRDVFLQKSTNGVLRYYVNNTSNGNAARSGITALNDAGTSVYSIWTNGTGLTTAGLFKAGDIQFDAVGGDMIIDAATAAKSIILAAGGSAAANEGLRIVSGMAVTKGYTVATLPAGTTGAIAHVTDQLTTCAAKDAALTGGGAKVCLVFYNGAAWVGA